MKLLRTALLGSALLLAGVRAAEAKIVYETYTGTISSGYDSNGRFGVPTGDLSGKTLKIEYRFDLGAGGLLQDNPPDYALYYGGLGYGTADVASVKVSVDGTTSDFFAGFYDYFEYTRGFLKGGLDEVLAHTFGYSSNFSAQSFTEAHVISVVDDFLTSEALGTPVNYQAVPERSYAVAYDYNGFYAQTIGNPVHVVVTSSPTNVPEPAALALFGLGAAVLAATRRRG